MRVALTYLLGLTFLISAYGQDHFEALIKAEQDHYKVKSNIKYKASGPQYDLVYQHLNLKIDPAIRSIQGSVQSSFVTLETGFTSIEFDLDSRMTVDSVIYQGNSIGFLHNSDVVQIALASLDSGILAHIEVFYHGDPSVNEYKGFSYDVHMTGPISWTLSEPYGAYGWWPCKQQLADKIDSFDMSIQVPKGNKAAGIGLLVAVDTLSDSSLIFHWEHRYPLATYLAAVAVTNYEEFTHYVTFHDGDSMPVLEYIYPEFMFIADTQAYRVEGMLILMDSLCGPYPFRSEKYGHAQWGRGGGMEHQTMSFMSDLDFSLMAHELAHQWYGDKITCGSWQDIWLNEGFATYLTAVAYEHLSSRAAWEEYMNSTLTRATSETFGSVFVYDTTSVSRIFSGRLSYSKAAMVIHMLRWELGDDDFYKGLKDYTAGADVCYEFAKTADLQFYMEQASGQNLDEFFDLWIYQQGFPYLTITWNRSTNTKLKFDISQLPSHPSVSFFPLRIEFRLRGDNGEDTLLVVPQSKLAEQLEFDVGFKVTSVEYDPNIWLLAKATLIEGNHNDLSSISVFPNPSSGSVEVYMKDKRIDELKIYNRLGQLVMEQELNSRKNESVQLNHFLNPGVYFIELRSGDQVSISKFVVQ